MRYLYSIIWLLLFGIAARVNGQSAPQLQWALSAGNTTPNAGEIRSMDMAIDAAGNRYVAGDFQMTADFDPSPATFNLTASYRNEMNFNDYGDIFFAKYAPDGSLLWAKTIGGPDAYYGGDDLVAIKLDNNGNIFLTGSRGSNSFDFDPSPATVILPGSSESPVFVAKYDSNGNYLWAFQLGGYRYDNPLALSTDNAGNIYLLATVFAPVDFDPSEATGYPPGYPPNEGFINVVAKYTSNGNYLWAKILTSNQTISNMTTAPNGNIFLTGSFRGTQDFDPSPAIANMTSQNTDSGDCYIAKYDTNGNYLWAKDIGSMNGSAASQGITLNTNGEIHCIGLFTGTIDFNPSVNANTLTALGNENLFIAKYDLNGNYLWAKAINNTETPYYFYRKIEVNTNGQVYISGSFQNTVDFDPSPATANLTAIGETDIFMAKYDSSGNYLWANVIGGSGPDTISAMALDAGGNINTTGNFSGEAFFNPSDTNQKTTSIGNFDIFIARYSPECVLLNVGVLGGYPTSNSAEDDNKTVLGTNGTIYVAGTFSQTVDFDPSPLNVNLTSQGSDKNIFIAKYTATGNLLWVKAIPGIQSETMSLYALGNDSNGNLCIAGFFYGTIDFDPSNNTAPLTAIESGNIFIAKYDSNGNYLWAKKIEKTTSSFSQDYIKTIVTNNAGAIYITGYYNGSLDFDPSSNTAVLTPTGGSDFFIAKYDSSGNYQWAKNIGGAGYDQANAMQINPQGEIYITGNFQGPVDFDPSSAVANLESGGSNGLFFAKYSTNGTYIWAKAITGLIYGESTTIALDQTNQIYLSGLFAGSADFDPSSGTAIPSSSDRSNNFIAKYNPNGDYLWAKPITGTSSANITATASDSGGNLIITGEYGIVSYDSGTDITLDPVAPGATFTTTGGRDIFMAKYDSNGNYLWGRSVGGPLDETINSAKINGNDEIVLTGSFMLTTDFDFTAGISALTSINSSDMFLAKYKDCSPSPVTVAVLGNALTVTTPADSYQWIDCNNNNAPVNGATQAGFTPTISGNYAAVVTINGCRSTSACQAILGVPENLANSSKIYPNPSSGIFNITLPFAYDKIEVQATDLTGKIIQKWSFNAQQELKIGLESAAQGIYFIQLLCDDETATFKILKN